VDFRFDIVVILFGASVNDGPGVRRAKSSLWDGDALRRRTGCAAGKFHCPLRTSARGRYRRTMQFQPAITGRQLDRLASQPLDCTAIEPSPFFLAVRSFGV